MNNQVPNIKLIVVVRISLLIFALINNILQSLGYPILPFENQEVETFVAWGLTTISAMWAAWKDNDITKRIRAWKSRLPKPAKRK